MSNVSALGRVLVCCIGRESYQLYASIEVLSLSVLPEESHHAKPLLHVNLSYPVAVA